MDESPSAPWHPLHQSPAKMVEGNCNLHYLVARVAIACTKQHHLNQPHQTLNYVPHSSLENWINILQSISSILHNTFGRSYFFFFLG